MQGGGPAAVKHSAWISSSQHSTGPPGLVSHARSLHLPQPLVQQIRPESSRMPAVQFGSTAPNGTMLEIITAIWHRGTNFLILTTIATVKRTGVNR